MKRLGSYLLILVLLSSCEEGGVPFPYVPDPPTQYNLDATFADAVTGPVAMFTCEKYHEYSGGLASQQTVCFDRRGHCLDYYYRDREACWHIAFAYDSTGRRIREETWRDTAGMSFDSLPLYCTTDYSYSRNGHRCKAAFRGPDGKRHTFRMRYDKEGNLTRFVFPDGSRISYDYDTAGRLVCRTWPDASTERYEYNAEGELTAKINRDGTYEWYMATPPPMRSDSLGRVLEEVVGNSSGESHAPIIATYVYDDHGNWVRRTTAGVSSPTILEVRTFRYYDE